MKATWLFDKHPIVIDSTLATVIGINESIVLQQLNYWLHSRSAKIIDDKRWVYNSFDNWQKDNFPFWSVPTIKRLFSKLEKMQLIESGNFNKVKFDRTKWYSINDDKLIQIMKKREYQFDTKRVSNLNDTKYQNDTTQSIKMIRPIPENNTENTTEITTDINSRAGQPRPKTIYDDVINYLNRRASTHYKPTTPNTKKLIKARSNEGFTLDDFKAVIDKKCADWLGNGEMVRFIRPQTLFGTKFESYLNERKAGNERNGGFDDDMMLDPKNLPDDDELPF